MSDSYSKKELQKECIDEDWIDVSDVTSSNSYTDPTPAITGGETLPTNDVLTCKLCQVSFSGVEPYQQHIIGNKHKKKQQKELMKKKYGPKYMEMLKSQESGAEVHTEITDTPDEDDDVIVKYCDVCKKLCTGEITYQLHMKGKPHQKKVVKMNLMKRLEENPDVDLDEERKGMEDSVYDLMPQVKPFAHCKMCNKKFSGPEGYQDHLSSTSHMKKLGVETLSKKLTGGERPCDLVKDEGASQNIESSRVGDLFARCSVCEKNFTGPVPYQQHLISEIHKKKLKKIELAKQINSLSVNDDERDTFDCKECGRFFTILEEFDQHLKSAAHTKKKTKNQLVKKLQDEYPEMEVKPLTANEEASLENGTDLLDNSFILICSVCHRSFSGPENARAHFTSPKHSKAKKQRLILEQHRNMENKKKLF